MLQPQQAKKSRNEQVIDKVKRTVGIFRILNRCT